MTRDDRAILLNRQWLALYLRVSQASAPEGDDAALAELLALRDRFSPQADADLGPAFDRMARLVALHLGAAQRQTLAAALARAPPLPAHPTLPAPPPPFDGHRHSLGPIRPQGHPGVSLVTCAMNRSANLVRALPSWLAQDAISEVVVVDWSSTTPVADDLAAAGIADPRLRILRVTDEPAWVLTQAFNAGFRAAACERVLKADADIVLAPDFFRANPLPRSAFVAGNWRNVGPGQAHVNGFFLASRVALHAVGGFNEHITSYGWDDDDIYDRLTRAGFRRHDVVPDTIRHLDHDDADRIGDAARAAPDVTLRQDLSAGTTFLIRRNRFVAMVMPEWDARSIPLPLRVVARSATALTVRRQGWTPSQVPEHVVEAANRHALAELASWRLGKRVMGLAPERLDLVLDRPNSQVSALDVEIALCAPELIARGGEGYLVLDLGAGVLDMTANAATLDAAFKRILAATRSRGLRPVLRAPFASLPPEAPACLTPLPLIASWEPLGDLHQITLNQLYGPGPTPTGLLRLGLTAHGIAKAARAAPARAAPAHAAPALASHRPRLFIDAQHGLGNRLRAMSSAAAIAEAAGRELVVVWQPDDHCDCRLGDLFDFPGAVEEVRFIGRAAASGAQVYNYMQNEPGARKQALILLETQADIYARSAFVLNSPASTWATENRFLRGLIPVDAVRDLVASVRHPNDISAHVRMEGGTTAAHLPYESAANWTAGDHALIDAWRGKSHFSHFLTRIDALAAEGRAGRIFLAADMAETYAAFQRHFGDRLAILPRARYDRSAEQLHYALADAILLGRSPLLLGSGWSSFSELAMRLAPGKIAVDLSGKDF